MVVLLRLGDFRFSVDTAAYQTLRRRAYFSWSAQPRLWNRPAIQFTGAGTEEIQLEGHIIPTFRGGLGQVNQMRGKAEEAIGTNDPQPMPLVTGYGEYLGE